MHSIIFLRKAFLSISAESSILAISLFSRLTSMLGSVSIGAVIRMCSGVMPARIPLIAPSRSLSVILISSRHSLFSHSHVDKLVFGMLLGVVAVVPNLRGEGMELIGGIT